MGGGQGSLRCPGLASFPQLVLPPGSAIAYSAYTFPDVLVRSAFRDYYVALAVFNTSLSTGLSCYSRYQLGRGWGEHRLLQGLRWLHGGQQHGLSGPVWSCSEEQVLPLTLEGEGQSHSQTPQSPGEAALLLEYSGQSVNCLGTQGPSNGLRHEHGGRWTLLPQGREEKAFGLRFRRQQGASGRLGNTVVTVISPYLQVLRGVPALTRPVSLPPRWGVTEPLVLMSSGPED